MRTRRHRIAAMFGLALVAALQGGCVAGVVLAGKVVYDHTQADGPVYTQAQADAAEAAHRADSVLYVYRTDACPITLDIAVNGAPAGTLKGHGFLALAVPPGMHTVACAGETPLGAAIDGPAPVEERTTTVDVVTRAGVSAYVEVVVTVAPTEHRVRLREASRFGAVPALTSTRASQWRAPGGMVASVGQPDAASGP